MKIKSLFAVALVGLALASTSNATVVQISLNQVYTMSSSQGFIDITGDGINDNVSFEIRFGRDVSLSLVSYNNPAQPEWYSGIAFALNDRFGIIGQGFIAPVYFTDELINGGQRGRKCPLARQPAAEPAHRTARGGLPAFVAAPLASLPRLRVFLGESFSGNVGMSNY